MAVDLYWYEGKVHSSYDGDSITCGPFRWGGGRTEERMDVRFALIDTPERRNRKHSRFWQALIAQGVISDEMVDELAEVAAEFIDHCLPDGGDVKVRSHRDKTGKYGRLICEVFAPADLAASAPHQGDELWPLVHPPYETKPVEEIEGEEWSNLNFELVDRFLAVPTNW